MARNDYRSTGRLAPPRADYGWGSGPPVGRARPAQHPDWDDEPQAEEVFEDLSPQDYLPSQRPDDTTPGRPTPVGQRRYRDAESADYVQEERTVSRAEVYAPPPTPPAYTVEMKAQPERGVAGAEPHALSVQERHQLLMRTIELYDDVWKLAGVRANPQRNRLEAYLVPRSKHMELKEASSRGQVLVITIDSRGNTDIREPRRRRWTERIMGWFFGE